MNLPKGWWLQEPGKVGFNIALSFFLMAWQNHSPTFITKGQKCCQISSLHKRLSYSNLKPEKLECDWVLDMIICCANVYLGRDNKPGCEAVGTNVLRVKKKDLRLRERLLVLTGMDVDQQEGKPGLWGFDGQSPEQLLCHNYL